MEKGELRYNKNLQGKITKVEYLYPVKGTIKGVLGEISRSSEGLWHWKQFSAPLVDGWYGKNCSGVERVYIEALNKIKEGWECPSRTNQL